MPLDGFTLRTEIYPSIEPEQLRGILTGKVALVTGSSRGIGKAIATAVALAGASVVINGRNAASIDSTVAKIQRQLGSGATQKIVGIVADVLQLAEQEKLVREAIGLLGCIDIVVFNAGTNYFQPFHQTVPGEWWNQMNLNVRAPVELTRLVIPQLMLKNSGCLIYVSSRAAVNHFPFTSAYGVSKAGITQFAACLQAELDIVQTEPTQSQGGGFTENRIEIFSIHPGEIATDLHKTALPPRLEKDAPYILAMRDKMKSTLPKFQAELPAWTVVLLASGRARPLKGQYVDCTRDIGEALASSRTGDHRSE